MANFFLPWRDLFYVYILDSQAGIFQVPYVKNAVQ